MKKWLWRYKDGGQFAKAQMKTISLFSGYIYLILGIITGIASNGFLKQPKGFQN